MAETAGNAPIQAADASHMPPTIGFFRKILYTGRIALRQFSVWRKAELLAINTAKSFRASRRYHRLTLPPPPTTGHKATPPIPSAVTTAAHVWENHGPRRQSRLRERATAPSPPTRRPRHLWNTSLPTPAAFVPPTCPSSRLSMPSTHLPQTPQRPVINGQVGPPSSLSDTPYETHSILAASIAIGIFFLLRLALASTPYPEQAQDRVDIVGNERRDANLEQQSAVGSPRSSDSGNDIFHGPTEDPLARYAVPRSSAVLVTHRRHYVVLEAEAESPLVPSESEGTAFGLLGGEQSDDLASTSNASTTDATSDASGSPVESPVVSLPSAYSQDSIATGEDSTVLTPDDIPRPLELPQDPMMRDLVLNVTSILNSLQNDPPYPLPCSSNNRLPAASIDTATETVRAMLYDPRDCDVVLAYLRRRHSNHALDNDEKAETQVGDLAEYEAALARIRQRRAELDPANFDTAIDRERPDLSAVHQMSRRFKESVAAGTGPYGNGTREEIRRWLRNEDRERRASLRSARRIGLGVGRKPDLGEILAFHSRLGSFLDLLAPEADSQQWLLDSDEKAEPEETVDAAEAAATHATKWATNEITGLDDDSEEEGIRVARGGPAIRNPRRPARGGKVRAPARHSYVPWDRRTMVFFEPRDLPSLGDVTTVVHDTSQEDTSYETEFRHAPRLLEKIEAERRRAVAKARAMRCSRMFDERGRPLAGPSSAKATILDPQSDVEDAEPVKSLHVPLLPARALDEAGKERQRASSFKRDSPSGTSSSQALEDPTSPPMEAEEVEQLQMLAMLRASRPKRR